MLKVYNTLSRQKEDFIPTKIDRNEVRMYVCGITPYDEVHLGHARCYVVFDVIRRYLKYRGYEVKYVQNFTDIDDKIINRSRELQLAADELARKYIDDYFSQMSKLNILPADAYPRVTQKIPEIIEFIKKIIENGFGYVVDGDVYFSVRKFKDYGKLSKRNIDELRVGARIMPGENKQDPLDFALWKKAKEGEPFWESPWGRGRPGWHIECSAMSLDELGKTTLDIHGGGQDLIFPHHENEIAQSEAALGRPFVKYWIHNGFVTVNKEKMSKSLGNFFTLRQIFEKYEPMVVRYMLLSQHYRQPLDFSEEKLQQAKSAYERIVNVKEMAEKLLKQLPDGRAGAIREMTDSFVADFVNSLDDDFNTAESLGSLHGLVNSIYLSVRDMPSGLNRESLKYQLQKLTELSNVLGLTIEAKTTIPDQIKQLVVEREEARKNKNWKLADQLRDKIKNEGFEIEDTKFGPICRRSSAG